MKTRHFILTLVALLAFAGNAWADTTKLSEADGWTKLTSMPTAAQIANNYFVFVDTNNDLMLGTGKGVNQSTKWYSLGVYYYTSVEPTSKEMNNRVWTLETYSNGYTMRNLEYSVLAFQTEWNAAYRWDTNDVPGANDWTKLLLAYADGSWTIQNGYYPNEGYLGPWNDGNFTNGAECAANKRGNNVGKFQIYTISRAQYKQNLLDNASSTNPVDLTPWYVTNATFDLGTRDGWTEEGSGGNNNTSNPYGGGCEIWHRTGFNIHQDVTVPNGKYKVSLQMAGTSGAGQVYGTSNGTTKTAASSAAAGSNFQNTILSMIQDRTFGQTITDEITVSNGSLTIGMKCETTDQWINFDNFKLYCTGVDLSSYQSQLAALVEECNTFISSNVVPDACETIVSNAVSTYNQTYSTAKEYSNAIVALTNVLNTYKNDTDLQAAYANFSSYKTTIETLSAGQESSTELTNFTNAVNTAASNVENATTVAAINNEIANLRTAGLTYISTADGQFDITFLASQNYSDWKKKDGSAAGFVADQFLTNRPSTIPSFAESYETTCATTGTVLYQTIEDLPAGYYRVGMYAAAMYTSGRGFDTEATEGDANRTFAFAGDLNDPSSILRTGAPISFQSVRDFNDLTTLDVNVHLTGSGNTNDLTFGVQKDSNGSNWHFAQIMSIVYSNQPDLTELENTRDALVSEAEGILAANGDYLTSDQKSALQSAITAGNAADNFASLNTVTLTTLPDAINTAKQAVAQAKAGIPALHQALERFEKDYNLVDGTDYQRVTMSAKAWTDLLDKVNAATLALDDISQASQYASLAQALNAQMDATDVSIRLFKSYKAMVEGLQSKDITEGTTYAANTYMDTDDKEQEAIAAMNTAFQTWATSQAGYVDVAGFLGDNLDFSADEGSQITQKIYDIAGWEEAYSDVSDPNTYLRNQDDANDGALAGQLYIRSNWGATSPTLTASKLKMLPEGKYRLTLSWNSNLQNMTNLSAYKLGATSTTIGQATSAAETLEYEFEVTGAATDFDLVFGFTRTTTGDAAAQILVDNITLELIAGDEFKMAYEAAQTVADNTAAKAAAKSAIDEYADNYASTAELNGFADAATRQTAINVLKNAKTIADANGDATSLVVNADLINTTVTDRAPAGWNTYYEGEDGGDIWVRTQDGSQVFNFWTGRITLVDMTQTIANLPKGAYRLSIDMGTDGFREDGSAPLFNFVNPSNMPIGASELVTTQNNAQNRAFDTYTSAAEVGTDHSVTIGVRSEGNYFQMKNIRLEYIGDATTAATETDNAYARQDFFWQDKGVASGAEIYLDNAEKYANASNVKVYPTGVNKIIHGPSGLFDSSVPNADNGGTCANLVITDGTALVNTRAFTATAATYSRSMGTTTIWGTLLLPYPLTSDDNVQYYTLTNVTGASSEDDTMGFTPASEVPANTPVVFKKLTEDATSITMPGSGDVTTTDAAQGATSVNADKVSDWTMEGVYAQKVLTEAEIAEGTSYYVAQNKFWKATATSGLTINPFRAYFHGPASSAVKSFRIMIFDDEATRIVDLEKGIELGGDIYTLGGQLVRKNATSLEGLPRGTYIIGGKKVFIK